MMNLGNGTSLQMIDVAQLMKDASDQRVAQQQLQMNDQQMDSNNQQMAQNSYAAGRQRIADDRSDQKYDTDKSAYAQYFNGDQAGARRTAISGNDPELVGQLDADQRQRAQQQLQTGGSVAFDLLHTPAEQRAAVYAAHAPAMKAAGYTDDQIASYANDLSDATLQQHLGDAQTLSDKIKQQEDAAKTQNVGGYMVDHAGNMVFAPPYIETHNADGSTTQTPNPLYRGGAGGAVTGSGEPVNTGGGAYQRGMISNSESGGNDNARNPSGSAAGRYQITRPTAFSLFAQHPDIFPETAGMTPAQKEAYARMPAAQEKMMNVLEPQYRAALASVGAPATAQNMYMQHFLGTGTGPKFMAALAQNPNTDAQAFIQSVDPKHAAQIISGNGAIFAPGSTLGSVYNQMGRRIGVAGSGSGGGGFSRPLPAQTQEPASNGLPVISGRPLGNGGAGSAFDPAALDDATSQYIITGKMPPTGMGKEGAAMRQAILNNVPVMLTHNGLNQGDIPRVQSQHKANQQTLMALQKNRETMQTSEETALANMHLLLEQSHSLPGQTRFPALNAIANRVSYELGNTDVQGMNTAYNTALTETAKVLQASPTGAGQLTEGARSEAFHTLQSNASYPQKVRAFNILKADMDNRIHSSDAALQRMQTAETTLLAPQSAPMRVTSPQQAAAPQSARVRVSSLQEAAALPSGTHFMGPDGQARIKH